MSAAIEVLQLQKSFGDFKALDLAKLDVRTGECFGILGPNGAGKTTLFRILSGLTEPQSGKVHILGLNRETSLIEIKKRIGVVPQNDGLDPELSLLENLIIFGQLYGFSKSESLALAEEWLKRIQLHTKKHQTIDSLSGGQRRRLAVAKALLHSPKLLFLDEPSTGLDPQARLMLWDFLKELQSQGVTLVLSTHLMEEADELCDRLLLLHRGQGLQEGTPREIIQSHFSPQIIELIPEPGDMGYFENKLRQKGLAFLSIGKRLLINMPPSLDLAQLSSEFQGSRFSVRPSELADVFLKIAGEPLFVEAKGDHT